ncbi:disease resistance protein RGA2-like [Magnolia sinica]|uniref:disease resistance protein RGA2-like n=1 Tax=Magnolia sinica TaxID=86752 RepID=UPI00265B675C|nr:disease resistance protein RGA2-like [Magnolia sinica]
MVDWIVSAAVEKLKTILVDKVAMLVDISDEIRKLSSTFTSIQALLEDAESRRVKDRAVKIWLEKVKDVAYDVEDILDEWMTEALKSKVADEGDGSSPSKKRKVSSILSPVTNYIIPLKLRLEIGSRIKEVSSRLDDIEKEKSQLCLRVYSAERECVDSEVRRAEIGERETGSLVNRSSIVGREREKDEVVHLLLQEVTVVPFVISIVGMGGLGKTTLAQLVYNDEIVKGHFEKRMWVCVSEDFNVKRITKSIIKSVDTEFKGENLNLNQLQTHLRKMLRAKRFLLVLDDIWSDDSEKWDILKLPFLDGALGSRIVITTRSEKVALAMGNSHIYKLAVLSEDDCWLLFRSRALAHRNVEERLELEAIGRKIVKKCGGVPLAAKTIGSAMCSRRTRREWELVLESDVWNSHDILQGILPALLLSYHDLPPALKQCFTYFSIFPKDSSIEKDVIIKLWVAQGFIRSDTSRDMEEIGGLYFDDLLRRSLLQDAELDDEKNIISDEADKVASISATLNKADKLWTLLLKSNISNVPSNFFYHWRNLRALDLSSTAIKELPTTVGKFKHSRYLDLSDTGIEELPEGVSNCGNLQTLRLICCRRLRKLPMRIGKMISLRHLEFQACDDLKYLPQGIGRLTSLRMLTDFIVGDGDQECKCGELKHLNRLQGRLKISGLENVRSRDEAREAELYKKQHLHALVLDYTYTEGEPLEDEMKRMEDVLEILKPHTNLKEFAMWNYKGSKIPKWIEDPVFSNLVKVNLWYSHQCKQLPGLGKLPSLKFLTIGGMRKVRKVGGEFNADDNNEGCGGGVSFPKLETLVFYYMPNWEEWELRGGDGEVMPSLLQLEINKCPNLKVLPCNLLPLLQKLT